MHLSHSDCPWPDQPALLTADLGTRWKKAGWCPQCAKWTNHNGIEGSFSQCDDTLVHCCWVRCEVLPGVKFTGRTTQVHSTQVVMSTSIVTTVPVQDVVSPQMMLAGVTQGSSDEPKWSLLPELQGMIRHHPHLLMYKVEVRTELTQLCKPLWTHSSSISGMAHWQPEFVKGYLASTDSW